jgi:hypothetical protein
MIIGGKVTRISDTSSYCFIELEAKDVTIQLQFKLDDPRVLEFKHRATYMVETAEVEVVDVPVGIKEPTVIDVPMLKLGN